MLLIADDVVGLLKAPDFARLAAVGLDHRNAPRHGRLKPDHAACRFGGQRQAVAVMRQKCFVGCDHIMARGNRRFSSQTGRALVAAHHLDKDVNVAALGQRYRVAFPSIARQIPAAIFLGVAG